jgi:hypothetical protein
MTTKLNQNETRRPGCACGASCQCGAGRTCGR